MDIYTLLKHGTLEGLRIGLTQSEAQAQLSDLAAGSPVSVEEMNGVVVIAGDIFEAHVLDDLTINLVFKIGALTRNRRLTLQGASRSVTVRTSLDSMVRSLHEAKIAWHFLPEECTRHSVVIITEGGATIEFVGEEGKIKINRIHLSEDRTFG